MQLEDQVVLTLVTAVSAMSLLIGLFFRLFFFLPRKNEGVPFDQFGSFALALFLYFAAFGLFYANPPSLLRQVSNAVCFMTGPFVIAFLIDFLLRLFDAKPWWPQIATYVLAGIFAVLIPVLQFGFGIPRLLYFSDWLEPPVVFFMVPWTLCILILAIYAFYLVFGGKAREYISRRPESKRRLVALQLCSALFLVCGIADIFTTEIPPILWAGAFAMLIAGAALLAGELRAMRQEIDSLYHQVIHDPLTRAFSRVFFEAELEKCLHLVHRSKERIWLVMIDIDDFKVINDTHGHLVGDHVLQGLAQTLIHNLRPSDIVGRLGGDEFAVLITGNDDEPGVRAALGRIQTLIAEIEIHDQVRNHSVNLHFSCSFGLSLLEWPEDEHDLSRVRVAAVHAADKALYRAKHEGKNRLVLAG